MKKILIDTNVALDIMLNRAHFTPALRLFMH